MATYGKAGRHVMPSFAAWHDAAAYDASQPPKPEIDSGRMPIVRNDDIDERANALLDDYSSLSLKNVTPKSATPPISPVRRSHPNGINLLTIPYGSGPRSVPQDRGPSNNFAVSAEDGSRKIPEAQSVEEIFTSRLLAAEEALAKAKQSARPSMEVTTPVKLPRLQRTKASIVRVTRAISERLSGSDRKQKKALKLAEKDNLARPKIQHLTGDLNSHKARHQNTACSPVHLDDSSNYSSPTAMLEDPFVVDILAEDLRPKPQPRHAYLQLSRSERCRVSRSESPSTFAQLDALDPGSPDFSHLVSGLTQHPDVGLFVKPPDQVPSRPDWTSTPRYRLECQVDQLGRKRLSTVLARESSPPTFDFHTIDEEGGQLPVVRTNQSASSLKRKAASMDLRFGLALEPKVEKLAKRAVSKRALGAKDKNRKLNILNKSDSMAQSPKKLKMTTTTAKKDAEEMCNVVVVAKSAAGNGPTFRHGVRSSKAPMCDDSTDELQMV